MLLLGSYSADVAKIQTAGPKALPAPSKPSIGCTQRRKGNTAAASQRCTMEKTSRDVPGEIGAGTC